MSGIKVGDTVSGLRAAEKIRARGVPTVIITRGARGVLAVSDAGHFVGSAFPMQPVDTTAAGDVFTGSLAVALAEGLPLRSAVCFANAAATISVTRIGAQPSAPTRNEIERLLRRH